MYISLTCAGRLGSEPEFSKNYCRFSIAVEEKKGETVWVRCVAFDALAEKVIRPYLTSKGQKVLVTGKPKASAWISKSSGEAQGSLELVVRELKILSFSESGGGNGNDFPPF